MKKHLCYVMYNNSTKGESDMENEMKQINGVRKNYLDNIRWITVVLVMVYHVIYLFNSQGVLSNFNVQLRN